MTIEEAGRLSANHRAAVLAAPACGCYYCQQTFAGAEVKEWVDFGTTALCPHCNIDAVLSGVTEPATLAAAHARWFEVGTPLAELQGQPGVKHALC